MFSLNFYRKHVIQILFILSIFNLVMFVYVYQNFYKEEYWIEHTHEVIENSKDLMSALKDAETGQRGYLLSSKDEYLQPYYDGVKGSELHLKKIKILVVDNIEQEISLKKVDDLIQEKLSELEQTIETSKYDKEKSIMILNTDHGKNIMDEIRDYMEKFIIVEKKLLLKRKKSFNTQNNIIFTLFIIELILIFTLLFLIKTTMKKTDTAINKLDKSLNMIDKYIIFSKTDSKGIITETSSAFEQLSGYNKDELIGKGHNVIRHPDNSKDFFKEI
ncbi:MAG: PAS domain S-box protein, partial [Sulfurimonas sp.]|nr:PAS domain S-box protein [Sulfurimonas sp.]